ncbi:MAG: sulfatase-like hydrolase/transferase, partial [bacterium]
ESHILLFSDHGEEFWDHQGFEHGHTQYEELIRVPLIIKLPGNRHAGKTVEAEAGLVDIAPTVLDYLDVKYKGAMQGTSLLRRLRGNHGKGTTTYFSQFTLYGAEEQAVIESGRKLMLRRGKPIHYFNLEADPKEKKSLLTSRPEKTASLYDKYQRWESSCHELKETLTGDFQEKSREWDPAEKKALRDLGYLE